MYPNVEFDLQSMSSDNLKTTMRARAASGDMPDIVTWMKEIEPEYLMDLTGQAFLDNLNADTVAGANGWQVLTRIKLPLISPTIVTCIILCVASAMKTFELPWTMTSGGPAGASTTMVLKIYNTAFNANRTGYATAQSTILFVLIASISFVLNIIMRRREARLQ